MRQLLHRDPQQLLTHELGDEERLRLVGDDPAGVVLGPFGHARLELGDQRVDAVAGEAGEWNVGVELAELGGRAGKLFADDAFVGQVGLAHDQDLGGHHLLHEAGDEAVAGTDRRRGLDQQTDDVDLCQRGAGPVVGTFAEQRPRLVNAGRVEQHELRVGRRAHPADLGARRLRTIGHDGDLLPDDPVHQRGLPDVGSPDQRHEPRAKGLAHALGSRLPLSAAPSLTLTTLRLLRGWCRSVRRGAGRYGRSRCGGPGPARSAAGVLGTRPSRPPRERDRGG